MIHWNFLLLVRVYLYHMHNVYQRVLGLQRLYRTRRCTSDYEVATCVLIANTGYSNYNARL